MRSRAYFSNFCVVAEGGGGVASGVSAASALSGVGANASHVRARCGLVSL
jgi:hypothetical protein